MEQFEFMSPTKFILQKDADLLCGREVKKYSDHVLFVHYGDKYMYDSGLHESRRRWPMRAWSALSCPEYSRIQEWSWSARA